MNGINNNGFGGLGGGKPVFENTNNFNGATGFGGSNFENLNSAGFHSTNPDYYKKALKGSSGINAVNSYGNLYSSGSSNYNQYQTPRQDGYDCVCVPYSQCPAQDVLGRKGDLILPIDPRNLATDIEAISDSNSTTTSNSTDDSIEITTESMQEQHNGIEIETTKENIKRITKREVSESKSDDVKKSDGEAVSIF